MRQLGLCLFVVFGLAIVSPTTSAEPPKTHEIIYSRPSGFWTSNRPAVGGAYRYRMLGVGLAVLLATGLLTWRLVRRTNAARRKHEEEQKRKEEEQKRKEEEQKRKDDENRKPD